MIGLFLEGNLQSLGAGDRMAGIRVCKQRHRFTQRVSPHASAHLPLLALSTCMLLVLVLVVVG
jgi:hypothetical protein